MNHPLMCVEYSRQMMIETIMRMFGADQPNPLAFKAWLESLEYGELSAEHDKIFADLTTN